MKTLGSLFASLALAGTALAGNPGGPQTQCHTDTIPFAITNWSSSVSVPKFNPTLGTLLSIQFTLRGDIRGSARAESLDASPTTVTTQFSANLALTRPDMSTIVVSVPVANFVNNFTAFDGTIDFGGTSGVTHSGISATDSQVVTSPPPVSDLALFTGVGNIVLPVAAQGSSIATGSGNLITQFNTEASATVTVCYTYAPNTPPSVQCPGPLMASVGVPISFQICASDVDPADVVTLDIAGLPAGAVANPPLPVVGNPACTTITWTPASNQVGSFLMTVTAIDTHQRSQTCTVTVDVAECHMMFGVGTGNSTFNAFGHLYDTQLAAVRTFYPVTMVDHPSFAFNALPQAFVVQVVMYNPLAFPSNPSQWSQAMRVIRSPLGTLSTEYSGTQNGIGIRAQVYTENGQQRVRFPFRIQGM